MSIRRPNETPRPPAEATGQAEQTGQTEQTGQPATASPAEGAPKAPGLHDVLVIGNGCAAPLDAVPLLSSSAFNHWIAVRTHGGSRLAALFALPADLLTKDRTDPPGEDDSAIRPENAASEPRLLRVFALLADDNAARLSVACTEVRGSYPALTPRAPQAHVFERLLYEQHGITPEGHPWLKPVRFSRPDGPQVGQMDFFRVEGDEVHEVAVGPIHAGVIECGHFRFQCLGERVLHLEISLGYHHRGVENLLAGGPHRRSLPLMEVTAGDSTVAHAWAYCTVVEALADLTPSPRGQLIRALALELERLANHTGDLGAMAGDVGFLPTLSYCGRLRGDWLNMTALLCGNRFGRGLLVPGGTAFEVDHALVRELRERLARTARDVQGAVQLIWDSPSVMARLTGIGPITRENATAIGLVGPAARACGLSRDVRHTHPLPGLPRPPDMSGSALDYPRGDVRSRAAMRHKEITVSTAFCDRLLHEFLDAEGAPLPEEHDPFPPLAPRSLAVALVEGWRGEVCHVGLTGADGRFIAYSQVDPSLHNWMGLALAMRGQQISDFPLCNKSFNLSYCGHDL